MKRSILIAVLVLLVSIDNMVLATQECECEVVGVGSLLEETVPMKVRRDERAETITLRVSHLKFDDSMIPYDFVGRKFPCQLPGYEKRDFISNFKLF